MNEANQFYEDLRSQHQAVINWRDNGSSQDPNAAHNGAETSSQVSMQSGNGEAEGSNGTTLTKDGIPSPASKDLDLTPNG